MKRYFLGFKIYYLVYLLLAFNAFINESLWMEYATDLLAVLGVGCALCMLKDWKQYQKVANLRLIGLFLISYMVSAVLNYRYGVGDNVKELIWMFLFMVVLYATSAVLSMEERKKEFRLLACIWVIYSTVTNAIGNSMVLWGRNYGLTKVRDGKAVGFKVVGFKWGRLWGMYDDPNHGATITVVAVLLAVYLFVRTAKWYWRVCLAVSVLIQFGYLVLSDSRTGLVSVGVGAIVWTTALAGKRFRENGMKAGKAMAVSLMLGVAVAGGIVGMAQICKQEYNTHDKQMEELAKKMFPPKKSQTTKTETTPSKVGRKQDLKGDASNGRLDIWKSGVEIVETSPVVGVSFRNMTAYAQQNMPHTYLVDNPENAKYDSLHNSVLDVLVSQGILGILISLALVFNTGKLLREYLNQRKTVGHKVKAEQSFTTACLALTLAMGVGSLFLSMVFYLNAPQTYIFWLCFGYLMGTMQEGEAT